MRRKALLAAFAAATVFAVAPSAAVAQDTPDEYADQWTEARRGDRTWMQRATEQLTMGPLDRIMGPSAEGAMKQVINRVIDHIDQMYNRRMDPCLAAAVNQAHNQTLTTGRQEVMRGAAEMLFDAGGGAAGGRNLAEFLGQTLYEQIKDKIKDRAIDKFKSQMRDRMKEGLPVYFEDDDNRAPCRTEFRIVWDKRAERYEFLFAGDCDCNTVSCGKMINASVPLDRWTITGWGTVIPNIEQLRDGDIRITYDVSRPRDVQVTANCCRGEGENRFRTDPRNATGNEWVGFVRQPQTQPPQQPDRPQTGSTPPGTGTTGTSGPQTTGQTPSGPPRRQIDIPEVPDRPMTQEELEQLGEQTQAASDRARAAHREASTYLDELQRREPAASADEIKDAEAAVEEAGQAAQRARAAHDKVMEKFNQLEQQQQSSAPPDPAATRFLAVHNAERAAVGAPPLRWDRQLAANAAAYAAHLARIGQLVHAPREGRGIERENLSQGMLGWSAEQMMRNWVREKANFIPGVYPNVSRTGRWNDVSHYSQMIWPTTTTLGCGMASGRGHQWLVCRYSPGGNKDGKPVGGRAPAAAPQRGQ